MENLKVLLLSASPMRTDTNMGKTFLTLLSDISKAELCQLYFGPQTPNVDRCNSYYRVCEKQLIRSFFGLIKGSCGGEVAPTLSGVNATIPQDNALALTRRKGTAYMRIAREAVWHMSHWKNAALKEWIEREKPNVIFTIMHDTNAGARATTWLAKRYHIPVVLFITDDYYHDQENSKNIFRKLYYAARQRANRQLGSVCKMVTACSQEGRDYFVETLKIAGGDVLYTPSAEAFLALPLKRQSSSGVVRIRYFGNLGLERYRMLGEIGRALQRLNRDGVQAMLEVYSSNSDSNITDSLNIENGSVFKGWVYGDGYMALLQDADIVIHTESFSEDCVRRTWASVSTKIADCLGAGKCILGVGPANVASMRHIRDAAFMVDDMDDLDAALQKLISDAALRESLQEKARALAMRDHDIGRIGAKVRSLLEAAARRR